MTKLNHAKKHTIEPIKPFKTINEEADFWDTHSVVKDINDGTQIGFHQANKTHSITIRISPKQLQEIRNQAFKKGVGPSTLARMWLMEKLQNSTT